MLDGGCSFPHVDPDGGHVYWVQTWAAPQVIVPAEPGEVADAILPGGPRSGRAEDG